MTCVWFWAWAGVGALAILSLDLGPLTAPPALLLGALVATVGGRRHGSAFGFLTGAGLPLLWVAYVQRQGPGTTCWHTAEQLSNVVDSAMKNDQAATFSFVVVSSSVTLIPSVNFAPSSTSLTSSWPLNRRHRSWAASKSL